MRVALDLFKMKIRCIQPCWAALPLAIASACPSMAQPHSPLSPVVVTATRSEMPLNDVLADVSILDRASIENSTANSVSELLARLPGITIMQNGGPASTTSVYIRGAESRFTAVFIDGVRIDSQSASGGATWEAIPLSQIERMEVVRGPAAAIYGSDAIAGVVQIFTKRGAVGFFPSLRMGLGTYNSRDLQASLRGGTGDVDYALSMADDSSDGYNIQSAGNPDRDGYRNRSFSGRLGWAITPGQRLELTLLDNDQKAGYDGSMTANDQALHRLQTFGMNWRSTWSDIWSTRFGLTQGTDRYETTPSPYLTETQVKTYLLRNEWRIASGLLSADLERREDDLRNNSTRPRNTYRHQDAVAVGYGFRAGQHAVQMNTRYDNDSEFGNKLTGALAYGYAITPQWRVSASTGTAFRVPTLFQRFSIYGSPGLNAETSKNNELSLRWNSEGHRTGIVIYNNDVSNLINYVSGAGSCGQSGCYVNTGHARMRGATLSAGTQLGRVNLGASVDVMDPKNLDTDKRLARRAKTQSTLTAEVSLQEWRMGGELQYVGERFDNAVNTVRMAPYSLIHLRASKQLDRDWRLQARVNNLTNKDYVLAHGYATAGRMIYLGVLWEPQH